MDLFVGAVDASAETAKLPRTDTGDSTDEAVVADYLRPAAVNSDYLDTAVNPAPWPTRMARTEPRIGRPALGRERAALHATTKS
jgi:hypothetical protein